MHNRFEFGRLALALFCAALGGCVAPSSLWPVEESEVIPPLPTFLTAHDCEMAYGAGACGTGGQVYGQAKLVAPPDAYHWYMPYSFGSMTGALLHDHYAPPGIYRAQVTYGSYLQPTVIQRYALVNPQSARLFRPAPQPIPQKPSPIPAFVNPPPHPGQRPDRLDRVDRPDRPDRADRASTGNMMPRTGDRKAEEKK